MNSNETIEKECQQLICGICASIMIFPVTLPCGHHMCLDCFKKSKELVSLLCPFCRKRISCWARRAKNKDSDIIDWNKWHLIQTKFPDLVQIRTSDNDWSDVFDEQIFGESSAPRVISSAGEIGREFKELLQQEKERLLAEEKASLDLIQKILSEDNKTIEVNDENVMQMTANDEEIARLLSNDGPKEVKTLRNRSYFSE